MRGGAKVAVEPHRHAGVFIARGKEDALVTKNLVPGEIQSLQRPQPGVSPAGIKFKLCLLAVCLPQSRVCGHASGHCTGDSVYGEKRISVEGEKEGEKVEYRVWNPFRWALHLLSCLLSAQQQLCFICITFNLCPICWQSAPAGQRK